MASSNSGTSSLNYENDVIALAAKNVQQFHMVMETNNRHIVSISVLSKIRGDEESQQSMEIWCLGDISPDGVLVNLEDPVVSHQSFEGFIMEKTLIKNIQRRNRHPPRRSFSPVRENKEFHVKVELRDVEGDVDFMFVKLFRQACEVMRAAMMNLNETDGRKFLMLLGRCTTLEELQTAIINSTNSELPLLSALNFAQTWLVVKRRQYKLFEIALTSSIHLLEHLPFTSARDSNSSLTTVNVCLRILKMLTTHPAWFKEAVEMNWILRIHADIWKDVIPQLFASLNHSDGFVCETILRILKGISEVSPHSICYPAIVNSGVVTNDSSSVLPLVNDATEAPSLTAEQMITDKCHSSSKHFLKKDFLMRNNCQILVEALQKSYPDLVKDIINFCREMQRINLLLEEKWLFVLSSLDSFIARHVYRLESEYSKSAESASNKQALQKKTEILSSLVHKILKDLYKSTCCSSHLETANEKQFYSIFVPHIVQAIDHFYADSSNIRMAWEPFKKLIETMSSRAMKRSALYLHTHQVSYYLSCLSSSSIPIPGQEFRRFLSNNGVSNVVTISKMHKISYVLPTKTRPKKITFIGSDGKDYTFLFKGHEDLHLDERVMQLLRICNTMLYSASNHPNYSCSVYSVTPLGPRSGLIQWVEGATPLFQIYRKWKVHELEDHESKRAQEEAKTTESVISKTGKLKNN